MADRTDKFEIERKPRSGADLWVKAPADDRGFPACPDLHLSFARAEELAYALLQAVEEAARDDLDLEHGLSGMGQRHGAR